MKKFSKIFIILILMILPKSVFALENNHILSIEKFNIKGSEIEIGGYSYISHIDNWGGKNLSTYIVVYTDDYSQNWGDSNWKTNCENSSNCYVKQSNIKDRNMWYARCTDNGCRKVASGITAYQDTKNKRNSVATFTNDCNDNNVNQCLYEDVGFDVKIDLATIASKFSGVDDTYTSNINFKIISVAKTKENTYKVNSPLRVYLPICKVNGSTCSSNVTSGDYTFRLTGLSDTVKYDAVMSRVRNNEGNAIDGVFFQEGLKYKVLNYSGDVETIDKVLDGNTVGKYSDILLQLDSVKTEEDYSYGSNGVLGKKVINNYDGKNHLGGGWSDNGHDYYAIATYVVFDGNLVINGFKPTVKNIECSDMGWNTSLPSSQDSSCGKDGGSGTDASYNQCKRYEGLNTENVLGDKGYIYVQTINSNCDSYKLNKGGTRYDKVSIVTDILINQKVDFKYGIVNPGTVYAGKSFIFSGTELSRDIIWMNAKITGTGKPYYKYTSHIFTDGTCDIGNYNMNDVSTYHYYDANGNWQTTYDLNVATVAVLENLVNSNYIKTKGDVVDNLGFKSCDSNDASSCDFTTLTEVSGEWNIKDDLTSNESYKLGNRTVEGVNTSSYSDTIVGKEIKDTYNYSLADSAVVVSGDEAGKAKYASDAQDAINANKAVNTGKKYFIDFKWIYEAALPFNLYDIVNGTKEINPSFVKEMDWELIGSCSIDVEDSYYTYDEGSGEPPEEPGGGPPSNIILNYRYRSISLSDPFPKGNYPINWENWYSSNSGRITGTYDKGVIYQYNLSKSSLSGGSSNDYSSMEGINKDGSSDFVDFGTPASNDSYCEIGYFSDDCDK